MTSTGADTERNRPVPHERAPDLPEDFCPYRGLQPYTEELRDFFFGREDEQVIIASNLYASPLTVLYGPSGVGKTSVLQAGVVPLLEKTRGVAVVAFREWQHERFAEALKRATLAAVRKTVPGPVAIDLTRPFDEFLAECAAVLGGGVFLVLDQFEEYFLYHRPAPADGGFDAEFARAVNRRDVHAHVLLSMREEDLSKLDRLQGRIPNLLGNTLRLEHLSREAAERAIRQPLAKYRELFPNRAAPTAIEDRLVEELLRMEVAFDQVGRGKVGSAERGEERAPELETPFLQMVLMRLWKEERAARSDMLRFETFENLGCAAGIVREHVRAAMQRLSPGEQRIAAGMFLHLVTPSGSKIAHSAHDLTEWTGEPEDRLRSLLTELATGDQRLLRRVAGPSRREEDQRYELYHDKLAQPILDWRREYVRQQEEEKVRQEEQRQHLSARKRLVNRAVVAMLVFMVLLVIALGWALRERAAAERARWASLDLRRQAFFAKELYDLRENEGAEGLIPDQDPVVNLLPEGSSGSTQLSLSGGERYRLAARCDNDCEDIDLRLFAGDSLVAADSLGDDRPRIDDLRPRTDDLYKVQVDMMECDVDACYYGYQVFRVPIAREQVLAQIERRAAQVGLVAVGDLVTGTLAGDSLSSDTLVGLRPGEYALVGGCDIDCTDLDMAVLGGGDVLDEDIDTGKMAVVRFTARAGTVYHTAVRMATCRAADCLYGYRVYAVNPTVLRRRLVADMLTRAVREMSRKRYGVYHDTTLDTLAEASADSVTLELRGGERYMVPAYCDDRCSDIDLRLFYRDFVVAADTSRDDEPLVRFTPKTDGLYRLTITMKACDSNPCFYGYVVGRRERRNVRPE